MAVARSQMLELGTEMPEFSLTDVRTDEPVDTSGLSTDKGIVVLFICNHCPYVKHIREQLVEVANDYQEKGFQFIAINSNDAVAYPDDAPDKMKSVAEEYEFPFPYLFDETQEVAKAYKAACTPDLFVFNDQKKLVYHGQFDESRPGNDEPVTGKDLKKILDALLQNRDIPSDPKPSVGCSIKWKQGNEPTYAS